LYFFYLCFPWEIVYNNNGFAYTVGLCITVVYLEGATKGGWSIVFNATFNNISVILWLYYGGGNQSNRRKPQTCRRSLTNFFT